MASMRQRKERMMANDNKAGMLIGRAAMAAAFGAAALWATTGIFVRWLDAVPLGTLIWLRFVLSSAVVVPVTLIMGRKSVRSAHARLNGTMMEGSDAESHDAFAGRNFRGMPLKPVEMGLGCLMTVYYILATAGFALGPVALTSLIVAMSPAVTIIWKLIERGHVPRRELIGFAVSVVGVMGYCVPLLKGVGRFGRTAIVIAVVAAIGATLVRALYSIALWRQVGGGHDVNEASVNCVTFLDGVILALPLMLFTHVHLAVSGTQRFPVLSGFASIWAMTGVMVLLVFAATILPNLLNTWASTHLEPTANMIIGMVTPPLSGILGWLLLDETLTIMQIIGMIITLLGVVVCNTTSHPE